MTDSNDKVPEIFQLSKYTSEIDALLKEYGDTLAPKIVEYEVEKCEFPVEVLNEIRAIYAHIYRASVSKKEEDIKSNIKKAQSHSKRAILDCYKYLCVAYDGQYHDFFKRYNYINWSRSNLQSDIRAIEIKRKIAVEHLRDAKTTESTEKSSDISNNGQYRELYEIAYTDYLELVGLLDELSQKISTNAGIVSRFPFLLCALLTMCGAIFGFLLHALL